MNFFFVALHVLLQKKIKVAAYYASEIKEEAMEVVKKNFGCLVEQIGDIRLLTEETIIRIIKKHGKIDLLIATPPCDQLSMVNPKRKGIKGMHSLC